MSPELAVVASCLLVGGFFAGAGAALVGADRSALRALAEGGHRGASLALSLREREERLVATCLVASTAAVVVAAMVAVRLEPDPWLAALWLGPAVLLLGEALPRSVSARYADALAPVVAHPVRGLQWALGPLLAGLSWWRRLLDRGAPERSIRREDIVELLDEGSGALAPEDRRLIQRVFAMTELTAERCMTPLVDVAAISEEATVREAIDAVVDAGHSRLPVYRDRIDNLVGVVHHLDLLGLDEHEPVARVTRAVRYVPDSKRADELLREMRRDNDHFAIVVDEYGGSVGLVTIEDMLEQLIGDIADEREEAEPAIRRIADGEWRVPARAEIEEVEEAIGQTLPEGDYETVAGLILAATGRIPEPGEVVRVEAFTFHIEDASERAIGTVRLVV